MPRPVPYLFCRYNMHIGDELLDAAGQHAALADVQGQMMPHGAAAVRENRRTVLVMRPKRKTINGEDVITWSVGDRPGLRLKTGYDPVSQTIRQKHEPDEHITYTDFIALPRLGALAIEDRISNTTMAASSALPRMRSIFGQIEDGYFSYQMLAQGDLGRLLGSLDLLEYSYTVRRYNPHAPSALAKRLHDAMGEEGIGIQRGVAKPMPGETMKAGEGLIQATSDLAQAGYGVTGFRGVTESGAVAQVPKPPFNMDRKENLRQQAKEQRVRMFFERMYDDEDMTASVVAELVRFYDHDAAAISPEPA